MSVVCAFCAVSSGRHHLSYVGEYERYVDKYERITLRQCQNCYFVPHPGLHHTISEAGGNNLLKDSTACCGLFKYSDDDYNHLDDDNINKVEMHIENGGIKKRVKTGRRRGNLMVGGPVEPEYEIMSVAEAHDTRIQYLSDRKKFRDDKQRERI